MSVMGKYDPCDDCKKICCSICRMKELETELTAIQREIEDGTLVRVEDVLDRIAESDNAVAYAIKYQDREVIERIIRNGERRKPE